MKHTLLFAISVLFISFGHAQKPPLPWEKMVVNEWKIDSISVAGKMPEQGFEELRNLQQLKKTVQIAFTTNNKVLLFIDREWMIMPYDLSKSASKKYINVAALVHLYFEIKEITPSSMTLFFRIPRSSAEGLNLHLSPGALVIDSLAPVLRGSLVEADMNSAPWSMPNKEIMAEIGLRKENKMVCNFGVADTGTWQFDRQNLELTLIGKRGKYVFEIESLAGDLVKLKTKTGSGLKPSYTMANNASDFDEAEEQAPVDEIFVDPVQAEEMPVEAMEEDVAKPVDDPYQTTEMSMSHTWRLTEKDDTYYTAQDVRIVFHPNGKVSYFKGKKEYKGSWEISRGYANVVLFKWGKRKEMANFFLRIQYNGDPSKDALSIAFVPPGEKELHKMEFIKVMP